MISINDLKRAVVYYDVAESFSSQTVGASINFYLHFLKKFRCGHFSAEKRNDRRMFHAIQTINIPKVRNIPIRPAPDYTP